MYYNFSNIRTLYYICVVESGRKKKSEFLVRNQMKLELKKERSTLDLGMLHFEKGITKYGKK